MISRNLWIDRVDWLFETFPVVGIVGPRQVGKTTLALQLEERFDGKVKHFDLENPLHLARLEDPWLALESLDGLVVLDEIQRRPEIFPVLRVLADRPHKPARFLVLGSASPHLLKQSSETLAGRIAYLELEGFGCDELDADSKVLWRRGRFPPSYLASNESASLEWRRQFVGTFLERDLPALGWSLDSTAMRRFWTMLAHVHGATWNGSAFARNFGVSTSTVRRYVDLLSSTFMARQLQPWHENVGKRQVKSPKVYLADCGVLHALLNIADQEDLESHPIVGASWEGFVIDEIRRRLGARREECFFWATHAGAEVDLIVVRGRRRLGFEVKRTSSPRVTPSMRSGLSDLGLESIDVVYPGDETFALAQDVRALAFGRLGTDLEPLS